MEFREFGDGHAVVFLHGTAPPESLYMLAERLGEGFRTLVPALPGYGDSEQLDERTPSAVFEALVEWIGTLDERPVSVVAHSAGAYHALWLAARHPELVNCLALLAPAHHYSGEFKAEFTEFAQIIRAGGLSFDDVLPLWIDDGHAAELEDALREPFARDLLALADDLDTYAMAEDLRGDFAQIRHPVYIRTGSEDVRTPVEYVAELEELLQNVRRDRVEGAPHFVQVADEEATVESLMTFIGRTTSTL